MADEHTAAAQPDPEAPGTGETAFTDADAPPATERAAEAPAGASDAPAGTTTDTPADAHADIPADAHADIPADVSADAPTDTQPEAPDYLALAQRTKADFENYRRRMAREVAQSTDRGMARLAKELLPALDHLELSLKAAEGHGEVVKGFAMVREELVAAMGRVGIQPFSPQGYPFDPNEHEAMSARPAEDVEPGIVVEVYQQGYRLNGTVLRPARVVVAQ